MNVLTDGVNATADTLLERLRAMPSLQVELVAFADGALTLRHFNPRDPRPPRVGESAGIYTAKVERAQLYADLRDLRDQLQARIAEAGRASRDLYVRGLYAYA